MISPSSGKTRLPMKYRNKYEVNTCTFLYKKNKKKPDSAGRSNKGSIIFLSSPSAARRIRAVRVAVIFSKFVFNCIGAHMFRNWHANMLIDDFNRVNDRYNLRMINIFNIRSRFCRNRAYRRATGTLVVINMNQLLSAELMSSYEHDKYRACTFAMY